MTYIIETGIDTLEGQLDERLRARMQLEDMLGWTISEQSRAEVEARISVVEDEILAIEANING